MLETIITIVLIGILAFSIYPMWDNWFKYCLFNWFNKHFKKHNNEEE